MSDKNLNRLTTEELINELNENINFQDYFEIYKDKLNILLFTFKDDCITLKAHAMLSKLNQLLRNKGYDCVFIDYDMFDSISNVQDITSIKWMITKLQSELDRRINNGSN